MSPDLDIRFETVDDLDAHGEISIAFATDRVLVPAPELGPLALREVRRATPFEKDYDTEEGGHPTSWPARFDVSTWIAITARRGAERVAGLVLAHGNPGLEMLEGRDDLAVIWDLRVAADVRGEGIGGLLVAAAGEWARGRGCTLLKVETQNVNVPACRFYERMGFELRAILRNAYPSLPDELQLLWYKEIEPR